LDFNTNSPIYLQIADAVKRKILSGQWRPGDKIPPVRELALDLGVNPNTAQRAVVLLESEGLLRTERTSGRYVTNDKSIIERARQELTETQIGEFMGSMRGIGYASGDVLEFFKEYIKRKEQS